MIVVFNEIVPIYSNNKIDPILLCSDSCTSISSTEHENTLEDYLDIKVKIDVVFSLTGII